jgi:type IV pilus assembly protein PilW
MMISSTVSQKGFSLLELMVTIAAASVLMAAISTFYHSQLKTHVTQNELVDMQQDARAAMYMMTREIRMAGYDPLNNTGAGIRLADAAQMAFDSDNDGTADGTIGAGERFYYGLRDGNLVRGGWTDPSAPVPDPDSSLSPVALNIDALNFVYLDSAGEITTDLDAIRSVQITLVARSGEEVRALLRKRKDSTTYTNQQGTVLFAPNDNFRRIRLTAAVKVRNLGL